MTSHREPHPPPLLLAELRRFVWLRWVAGAAVVIAATVGGQTAGWTVVHGRILIVGAAMLIYNAVFWLLVRRTAQVPARLARLPLLVRAQLLADLGSVTLLVMWTGGLASPLLLAFILLMVSASLMLTPLSAYAAVAAAVLMVFAGLRVTGQWPADPTSMSTALAWLLTLLLTVYLTNHITGGLRAHATEARHQSRRTQAILEAAADGIITIDGRGIVQSVNPAAVEIFGYAATELIGRNINLLMPEPFHGEHDRYLADYLRTGEARIIGIGREAFGKRKDGTVIPIELAVSEVRGDVGRLFTGIVRDISDRKNAEAQLKQLNGELLRHQEVLIQHEKMVAMGQMAAGVAHEIGNPLASMDSLLQLIARHPERLGPDTAMTLREQIKRIDRLVQQMKDFAHPVDSGWETVPVNAVVERALEMIRFDPRARRVDLESDLSPEAGSIHVMPQAIEQVVVNLALNALDALAGVPEPRLVVSTRPEPGGCVIEVSDNGRGIAPEHLGRVFEPFFTTKPVGKGTGLGLSISYSLVERNRGRIEAISPPASNGGQGTVMSLHLPSP